MRFKVGDLVKVKGDIPLFGLGRGEYTIRYIKKNGSLIFNNNDLTGYWPENFELAKSQIINNILNDL